MKITTTKTTINFDLIKFGFKRYAVEKFKKFLTDDNGNPDRIEVFFEFEENKMMVTRYESLNNISVDYYYASIPENQQEADILFKLLVV